jgi:hypothetical protein
MFALAGKGTNRMFDDKLAELNKVYGSSKSFLQLIGT